MKTKGFTLIELLIVVAIIAILAAIAVPNFLEAQTRAKVSRAKADLRSLAVAEEAYCVDWNSFTKADQGGFFGPEAAGTSRPYQLEGWKMLTTPVAYITSISRDPFGAHRWGIGGASPGMDLYQLGTGEAGVKASTVYKDGYDERQMVCAANTYMMGSKGPDHLDQTVNKGLVDPPYSINLSEQGYPWPGLRANDPAVVAEVLRLVYDPTNGTVSWGDILRFGGQKPSGQAWEVLWAASSK